MNLEHVHAFKRESKVSGGKKIYKTKERKNRPCSPHYSASLYLTCLTTGISDTHALKNFLKKEFSIIR